MECQLQIGLRAVRVNILIVDRDLGFVFWLGQILDSAGYVAIPARGVAEAAEIVSMLRLQVDALIAPPAERGLREFTEKLRFNSRELQVVNLGIQESSSLRPLSDVVWKPKPLRKDETSKAEWLSLIHSLNGVCASSVAHG